MLGQNDRRVASFGNKIPETTKKSFPGGVPKNILNILPGDLEGVFGEDIEKLLNHLATIAYLAEGYW